MFEWIIVSIAAVWFAWATVSVPRPQRVTGEDSEQ